MCGTERQEGEKVRVGIVPRSGIGQRLFGDDHSAVADRFLAVDRPNIFGVIEDPAQFFIRYVQTDVVSGCVQMKDAAALAASVAAEDVFVQLDVQVRFQVVAERAPAVELGACAPDDMYAYQINNVLDTAGEIAVAAQFSSPS